MKSFVGMLYKSDKWDASMEAKIIDRVEILGEGKVNQTNPKSIKSVRAKIVSGDWWMMIGADTEKELEEKISSMVVG